MSEFNDEQKKLIMDLQDTIVNTFVNFGQIYDEKIKELNRKLEDSNPDESTVKELKHENEELRAELNILKRRYQLLETQSQYELEQSKKPEPKTEQQVPDEPPREMRRRHNSLGSEDNSLNLVNLKTGTYVFNPDTRELFDYYGDNNIGPKVGALKAVVIRQKSFYINGNEIYEMLENRDVGDLVGEKRNGKAVFYKR
jgi:hypothetical protein